MIIKNIQFKPEDGEKERNLKKIKEIFNEIELRDTELVLLPELWSTGAKFEDFEELSEKIPGKTTRTLSDLAKQNDVYLVAGSIVEKEGNKLYNTIPVLNPKGELIEKYRKIHLFSYTKETEYLSPGKKTKKIKIKGRSFGLTTCYDLRFPTQYRKMALTGVEAFLCPAAWPKKRKRHWKLLNKSRAIENQAFLISCNRRGKYKENEFIGNSYIIGPQGNILNKGSHKRVITTKIDLNETKETRKNFPTLKDYKEL